MSFASEFDDKKRRALFGAQAQAYGDGRPGYPPEVFEHLQTSCGLAPGCRVLEVGPGAGQATGPLLAAGAQVLAIETAEEFVALLQTTYERRSLEVRVGEFESVDLPAESVDMVAAATSFHWVPAKTGLDRAADVLRPGGSLALWWNHYGDPDRPDPFRLAVQPILMRHAPHLAESPESGGAGIGAHPYALDSARISEIDRNGRFSAVEQVLIPWTQTHTAAQVRMFLASFSNWMALEDHVSNDLLDAVEGLVDVAFGGVVERPFLTAMYTATRR